MLRGRLLRRFLWMGLLGCWCGLSAPWAMAVGVSVTDDRGVTQQWAQSPKRIVSLLPSLTETLCDMGACDRLVGVDRYASFPAQVRRLPRLGGQDDVLVEHLLALQPDVVLMSRSSRVIDRLASLGVKVVALEPATQDDVERVALKLGQLLGQPDAGPRLWRRLQAQIDQAARGVPAAAKGWRVYHEVDSAPYAAGASSFIGHLLSQLGLVNIVGPELGPFPKLNPEFVVRGNPQVIMVAERQAKALPLRPGWSRIDAVVHGRVCTFSAEQTDLLSRPGPRLGEGAEVLAACLRRLAGGQP